VSKYGQDPSAVVEPLPSAQEVMAIARALLRL